MRIAQFVHELLQHRRGASGEHARPSSELFGDPEVFDPPDAELRKDRNQLDRLLGQ